MLVTNVIRPSREVCTIFGLSLLLVLLGACQAPPQEPSSNTADAPPVKSLPASTSTAKATVTPIQERATVAIPATSTVEPEAKEPTVVPSPTLPPAEHISVGQVAYAPSECSDKYPCNEDHSGWLARISLPAGFEASVYTQVDDFPTSITFGPERTMYIAGHSGSIYRVDEAGQVSEYLSGFKVPTGIAFLPGTERLFVSSRVTDQNTGGEAKISVVEEGQVTTLYDGLPCCYVGMHGPNGIAFGPDGFGYVGVGGRADHGERLVEPGIGQADDPHPLEASILRFDPDGGLIEAYAHGFRNPYDIAWDANGVLFATDNGHDPDLESGRTPPDELHQVIPGGEHGYPYFECSLCFGIPDDVAVIQPILELIPHAAVTGLAVYTGDSQPGYFNDLFLVTWSAFEGAQKVVRFSPDSGESSDFATGFAQPIDITVGPEGDLYVADFATGLIYRITNVG